MITWKLAPKNPRVSCFVEAYWLIHKAPEDQSLNFPKLYPDVSAQLILAADDYRYEYVYVQHRQTGVSSHCILPHSQTFTMDHSKAFIILGVKIRPGMHNAFSALITQQQLNAIVPLNKQAINIDDVQRWLAPDYPRENTIRELDKWLNPLFEEDTLSTSHNLIVGAIELLSDNTCSELGQKLGLSQRTLERHFQQQTLMTLKQFQSATRAEKLLEYLYLQDCRQPDWADVSAKFGFSDQSHLIRELKQTIGVTPNTYWQDKDLTIDVYGDFHASSHCNKS